MAKKSKHRKKSKVVNNVTSSGTSRLSGKDNISHPAYKNVGYAGPRGRIGGGAYSNSGIAPAMNMATPAAVAGGVSQIGQFIDKLNKESALRDQKIRTGVAGSIDEIKRAYELTVKTMEKSKSDADKQRIERENELKNAKEQGMKELLDRQTREQELIKQGMQMQLENTQLNDTANAKLEEIGKELANTREEYNHLKEVTQRQNELNELKRDIDITRKTHEMNQKLAGIEVQLQHKNELIEEMINRQADYMVSETRHPSRSEHGNGSRTGHYPRLLGRGSDNETMSDLDSEKNSRITTALEAGRQKSSESYNLQVSGRHGDGIAQREMAGLYSSSRSVLSDVPPDSEYNDNDMRPALPTEEDQKKVINNSKNSAGRVATREQVELRALPGQEIMSGEGNVTVDTKRQMTNGHAQGYAQRTGVGTGPLQTPASGDSNSLSGDLIPAIGDFQNTFTIPEGIDTQKLGNTLYGNNIEFAIENGKLHVNLEQEQLNQLIT